MTSQPIDGTELARVLPDTPRYAVVKWCDRYAVIDREAQKVLASGSFEYCEELSHNGNREKCPTCNGTGYTQDQFDGAGDRCDECGGKGSVAK